MPRNEESDELAALRAIARWTGRPPEGETWVGDDAAVLASPGAGELLFATDLLVESVHFSRALSPLSAVGWKALVCNLSDLAAMAGQVTAAVVGVAGATIGDLEALFEGLLEAGSHYGCPVVGGDLSDGGELVISVAVLGTSGLHGAVLRSGARAGDHVFVTGALGAAAAGLRELLVDRGAQGPNVDAQRRPIARIAEGAAASMGGASAMIDVSDGFGLDIDRLASASGVGVRLDEVPIAPGATLAEALGGGEDYELVFTAPDWGKVYDAFDEAGLERPARIGEVVADPGSRLLGGRPFAATGYAHGLGPQRQATAEHHSAVN